MPSIKRIIYNLVCVNFFVFCFIQNAFAETKTQTHTYTTIGTHNACVTVTDSLGASTQQCVTITTRGNTAPTVGLSCTPTSGLVPLSVSCTATATDPDGDTMTYAWNFGDASPPPPAVSSVSHTYQKVGTYYPSVSVSDGENSTTKSVKVSCKKKECGE